MSLLRKFKICRASLHASAGPIVARATDQEDVGALIDAYWERIAIVSYNSNGDEVSAHAIARQEVGLDIDDLARLQLAHWRRRLLAASSANGEPLALLAEASLALLSKDWTYEATRLGWTDQELFGLDEQRPQSRTEAMGLIVFLSASGMGGPFETVEITESLATFYAFSGCKLAHQRFRGIYGPPIWEHLIPTSCATTGNEAA